MSRKSLAMRADGTMLNVGVKVVPDRDIYLHCDQNWKEHTFNPKPDGTDEGYPDTPGMTN